MKILRNYILKELIGPFLISLAVFTFAMLVGNMVKMADMVINKGVSIISIFKIFIALIPYLLSYTLPMALLTATIMCFGRLASDNEIIAMRASGISLYKIGFPVIIFAFLISLFQVHLNDSIIARAHYFATNAIREVGMKNPAAYLEPGTFIKDFKNYIVFIHSINGNKLNNVRIYKIDENAPTRTIIAQKGEFTSFPEKGIILLKLINGSADEPNPKNPNIYYKVNFKKYNLTLDLSRELSNAQANKKPKDMSIKELKAEILHMKTQNINSIPLVTEIHKKIALAFSGFVFVLVGLPLAINTRRREKSVAFALSLVIILTYYGLFIIGEAIALKEVLPAAIGTWIANIVFFLIGILLIAQMAER
ncbi:MAG: LptF/LptG family permease [Candidatus Omnitrophica bacterium]|nr:LptF/LptG family permease [Candidatus Omnitrophota bacterium]